MVNTTTLSFKSKLTVGSRNCTGDVSAMTVNIGSEIIRSTLRAVVASEINRQVLVDVVDEIRMVHVEPAVQDTNTDASASHSSIPSLDSTHSGMPPLEIKQKV
jgi:hypothetical protein